MTVTVGLVQDRDPDLHLYAVIVIGIALIRIEMNGETRLAGTEEATVIDHVHLSRTIISRHPRNARDRTPLDDNSEIIAIDSSLVGLVIGPTGRELTPSGE